jgi:hypothetical protein
MMLAEFTSAVGAYDFGLWIFCLFALLGALNQGAALIARFREQPPAHEKYATIGAVEKIEADVDDLRDTITANYNSLMKSNVESRSRMHAEINTMGQNLAEFRGVVDQLKGVTKDIGLLYGILQNRDK